MPSGRFLAQLPHLEELIIGGEWNSDTKVCLAESVRSLSNLKRLDLRLRYHVRGESTDSARNPVNDALMTALTERCVEGRKVQGTRGGSVGMVKHCVPLALDDRR